ncbi:hypothetical protein [Janthinobacterium sp.]|uniref:hypothetical protein n=1 Tax=Janthinobacterium sp. TaxID=1871054 RepID=UPI00293D3037|nr:hypothetical protein [Janthinobacterium sp.]
MAIDRLPPAINLAPLITQRLDVSNATPLAADIVRPLVALGPYMAAAPDAGAGAARAQEQAFASLAATLGPDATPHDSSAMQENQLFFSRQLVWQVPNPATLAASWRVMVKTYGEQYAALQEQARGQHVPGNILMAEQNQATLREGARPPLAMDAEAWRFAVYGWGGQRLMLRVLASDPDEEETAPKRRRGKVALRLELMLPERGRVLIQMEPVADGILLELAASETDALLHLRRLLPQLAEVIARAGLRVVRCRVNQELHGGRIHSNFPMQAAASLSLPVFRAMAEVALLLTQAPQLDEQEDAVAALDQDQVAFVQEQSLQLQQAPLALEPDLAPDAELEESFQFELELELEEPAQHDGAAQPASMEQPGSAAQA